MIGEIQFQYGPRRVTAELARAGRAFRWVCEFRDIEEYLNTVCPPPEPPAAGGDVTPGAAVMHFLYQVGERLGGEVRPARGEVGSMHASLAG